MNGGKQGKKQHEEKNEEKNARKKQQEKLKNNISYKPTSNKAMKDIMYICVTIMHQHCYFFGGE